MTQPPLMVLFLLGTAEVKERHVRQASSISSDLIFSSPPSPPLLSDKLSSSNFEVLGWKEEQERSYQTGATETCMNSFALFCCFFFSVLCCLLFCVRFMFFVFFRTVHLIAPNDAFVSFFGYVLFKKRAGVYYLV